VAFVFDLQRLAVVASALADVALHVDIRQEVHFDHVYTLAVAGFAATSLHVEAELSNRVTTGFGLHRGRNDLMDGVKGSCVGGWVGARGAVDRRLIDDDHLFDRLNALEILHARGEGHLYPQLVLERWVEKLVDHPALAAAAHPGHADQATQRKLHVKTAEFARYK